MPANIIRRNIKESVQIQVENYLLRKIESAEWPVGSKILSERALSETLQVSRTTIRNAINTLTKKNIFVRKVGQGTFVNIKPTARIKTQKNFGTIGYVIHKKRELQLPISVESFYFDIFSYLEEECAKIQKKTQLFYIDDSNPLSFEQFSDFLKKIDGIIIDGEDIHNPAWYTALAKCDIPVIFHCSKSKPDFDTVVSDDSGAIKKIIQYLSKLKHTKIGMVNGTTGYECSYIRYSAWVEGLKECNVSFDDSYCIFCKAWTADEGYKAAKKLMRQHPELTAIVCANDLLAIGVISALVDMGKRIPEDISITGYDNTEWSRHCVPPLTTVNVFAKDIARAAVQRIHERITYGDVPLVHIQFQTGLIFRKSCTQNSVKEDE